VANPAIKAPLLIDKIEKRKIFDMLNQSERA
jgi:hypothetical protein